MALLTRVPTRGGAHTERAVPWLPVVGAFIGVTVAGHLRRDARRGRCDRGRRARRGRRDRDHRRPSRGRARRYGGRVRRRSEPRTHARDLEGSAPRDVRHAGARARRPRPGSRGVGPDGSRGAGRAAGRPRREPRRGGVDARTMARGDARRAGRDLRRARDLLAIGGRGRRSGRSRRSGFSGRGASGRSRWRCCRRGAWDGWPLPRSAASSGTSSAPRSNSARSGYCSWPSPPVRPSRGGGARIGTRSRARRSPVPFCHTCRVEYPVDLDACNECGGVLVDAPTPERRIYAGAEAGMVVVAVLPPEQAFVASDRLDRGGIPSALHEIGGDGASMDPTHVNVLVPPGAGGRRPARAARPPRALRAAHDVHVDRHRDRRFPVGPGGRRALGAHRLAGSRGLSPPGRDATSASEGRTGAA